MAEEKKGKYISKEIEDASKEDVTRINNEVISTIAGIALSEIPGVAAISTGLVGGILGRKSVAKGIKVETTDDEVKIDVTVILEYGTRIPEVAGQIQSKIRKAIEEMTGKYVQSVNVTVQGIKMPAGTKQVPVEEKQEVFTEEEKEG